MTGRLRALWRLLALQATWNFERMQGIGMGHAAEPLLEELKESDAARQADAVVRSAEFFNCHPYLAGVALGATVRAEYEGVPGAQIVRLRTALCGPLGALGDRLFWIGVVPLMMSAAALAVVEGAGLAVILALLVVYNALRLATGVWSLEAGLRAGIRVSGEIAGSWLTRAAERVGPAAGFMVGLAIPKVAASLLAGAGAPMVGGALVLAIAGVMLATRFGSAISPVRLGLVAILLTLIYAGR
ncbi:MAG: PTS system mannose/fructose/sorbose family transporter subunit IID [Gemmatimonadales bacterium]